MTTLRLVSLKLRAFKGIRELDLRFDGKDATISGENGVGKTSAMDAWLWLVAGRDSRGAADFAIKTIGEDGEVIKAIDHEVEAELEIRDYSGAYSAHGGDLSTRESAQKLKLRRVYRENWVRPRQQAEAVLRGHETAYFIDGESVQAQEYGARLAQIASPEAWMLLSNLNYFSETLDWKKRRALLLDVCGQIADADVIAGDDALTALPEVLAGRSVDDHLRRVKSELTTANREIGLKPTAINEARLAVPAMPEHPEATLRAWLKDAEIAEGAARQKRAALDTAAGVVALKSAAVAAEADYAFTLATARREAEAESERQREPLRQAQRAEQQAADALTQARAVHDRAAANAGLSESSIERLVEAQKRENATVAPGAPPPSCPQCGYVDPDAAATHAAAIAAFNRERSERLGALAESIETARAEHRKLAAAAKATDAAAKKAAADLQTAQSATQACATAAAGAVADPQGHPAVLKAQNALQAAQRAFEAAKGGGVEARQAADQSVRDAEARSAGIRVQLNQYADRAPRLARVAELERQAKELAVQAQRLEREKFLCEKFIVAKARMLESKCNELFEYVTFRLFRTLITTGEIEPICETEYGGVDWANLNFAARVCCGMDICAGLARHFGVSLPLFCDQAESVCKIIPYPGQVIKLQVAAGVKPLRLEVANV